jgi:hypothetical protein
VCFGYDFGHVFGARMFYAREEDAGAWGWIGGEFKLSNRAAWVGSLSVILFGKSAEA